MKIALGLFLVGLCALAIASPATTDGKFAKRQGDILRLFNYINQASAYPEHLKIAQSYDIQDNVAQYSKPEVVQNFYQYIRYGTLLPRGQVFSVFNDQHLKQAIALFKLFYYANDFDTLYRTAVYARNNFNEGLFLYSFSVALLQRPDTYNYVLPPIYEIYPYYFYNSEVIQQAQYYRQIYSGQGGNQQAPITVYANYNAQSANLQQDQSLSYFTDDVGVNAFYYYYNLYYPFWLNGEEFNLNNDNRGALFFYINRQILARYYLERLSNGFGDIEYFNYELPFQNGYYPSLRYPNGLEFPARPNYANLYEYFYNYGQRWQFTSKFGYSYTFIQDYESRFRGAIDSGFVLTPEGRYVSIFTQDGVNTLGNLIEGNADSPYYQYYGAYQIFARHLLGYSYQPYNLSQTNPSALEHFETSLRDPAFYQIFRRLLTFYFRYLNQNPSLKPYTASDLTFDGVSVKNVQFDALVTYFDTFTADLSNAIYVTPEEFVQDTFKIQVEQQRLNHRPFSYRITVNSTETRQASVRVYLGPKYDEYGRTINLTQNLLNFVQFDHFTYDLTAGENIINRDFSEIYNILHDRSTYQQQYQQAVGAYNKNSNFQFNADQIQFGFPHRLLLPRGSQGGTVFQIYVIVSPVVAYQNQQPSQSGQQYVDGYPLGYPFNRPIEFEQVFNDVPNSYFQEVTIYHRDARDINASPVHSHAH